ncbi:unnamed protein product [Rhizoctonia solani]|uniref:C3H1-type domain-containing protein n=1 Tax=Rhizoctonia solani TaxID=456999 RepID=A0A8H3H609_9AGAM|nr:unnamed protein product [Rhizoctonia solani]
MPCIPLNTYYPTPTAITTTQGLAMNDSGFIERTTHSTSTTPTSFMEKSPKVEWADADSDVTMKLNADTTRSSVFPTRTSRSRTSNKRSRPYQDTASRPSSHQRTPPPCRYYQAGNCTSGDACRYRHVARSTSPESDLDQQLLAFVKGEEGESPETIDDLSPAVSKLSPKVTYNPDDFPDEEELYEVITHPSSTISEVRFNTRANPGEVRTYFVVQRQPVVEYEGKNVGILSGGVLLGVPLTSSSIAPTNKTGESSEEPEIASSSPSPVSNDSDHELWKGPVRFEDSAAETESLVWADDADDTPMEAVDSELDTYSLTPIPELPSPPPIIRRIIRQVDGHNRRHSLS